MPTITENSNTTEAALDDALEALEADFATCKYLEFKLRRKTVDANGKTKASKQTLREQANKRPIEDVLNGCIDAIRKSRKRKRERERNADKSDYGLSQLSRFTHRMHLEPFARFLHYVPRLVNVVCSIVLRTAVILVFHSTHTHTPTHPHKTLKSH